jgi:hypothetical protein
MATLREELQQLQKEAQCSRGPKSFYPPHDVRALLTLDRIGECLSKILSLSRDPRDIHRFSSLVWETSLTIFATLLLNGHEKHIMEFLYRREMDSRLPYTRESLYFIPKDVAFDFQNRQWELIPVILQPGEIHRELGPHEVLPFLSDQATGEGGFGTIFKVQLETTCQKLVSGQEVH